MTDKEKKEIVEKLAQAYEELERIRQILIEIAEKIN